VKPTATPTPSPASSYSSKHIFVLILENRSDAEALKYMPYVTSLANSYTTATQSYSPAHGSFLAYLEMGAGAAPKNGQALNPPNPPCDGDGCFDSNKGMTAYIQNGSDNIVKEVEAKGLTWRGYFQSMPSIGFMSQYSADGLYVARHNVFPFLPDIVKSKTEQANMVPWGDTTLKTDLAAKDFPNYTWLIPDLTHDGHNPGNDTQTALTNSDNYLKVQLPILLASSYFQKGGDGVLFILFDESDLSGDDQCSSIVKTGCGGHIFSAIIGPNVKKNFSYTVHMEQNTMLRATCDLLGIKCPGDGTSVVGLKSVFQ